MLLLLYGYKVDRDGEDEMLRKAFQSVEDFAHAAMPGAFIVDVLPARKSCSNPCETPLILASPVRWIPSWFPGAGWKRTLAKFRSDLYAFADSSMLFAKQQMVRDTSHRLSSSQTEASAGRGNGSPKSSGKAT